MNKQKLLILLVLVAILGALALVGFVFWGGAGESEITPNPEASNEPVEAFPVSEPVGITPNNPLTPTADPDNSLPTGLADPTLHQIADAVAPGFWLSEYKGEPAVYYAGSASGLIYRDILTDGTDPEQLAQATVAGNVRAHWWRDGENNLGVLLAGRENVALLIKEGETSGGQAEFQTVAVGLTGDEKTLAINAGTPRAVTQKIIGDQSEFNLVNLGSGQKEKLFTSTLTEWLVDWPTTKNIMLVTKPSGRKPGLIYSLSPDNGTITKLAGPLPGLNGKLSPDGKSLIYSSGASSPALAILNLETNETKNLTLATWADKCAWASDSLVIYCAVPSQRPPGNYPDDWYMGRARTADNLWRIDSATGEGTLVWTNPNIQIDVSEPKLNQAATIFVFLDLNQGELKWLELSPSTETPDA